MSLEASFVEQKERNLETPKSGHAASSAPHSQSTLSPASIPLPFQGPASEHTRSHTEPMTRKTTEKDNAKETKKSASTQGTKRSRADYEPEERAFDVDGDAHRFTKYPRTDFSQTVHYRTESTTTKETSYSFYQRTHDQDIPMQPYKSQDRSEVRNQPLASAFTHSSAPMFRASNPEAGTRRFDSYSELRTTKRDHQRDQDRDGDTHMRIRG